MLHVAVIGFGFMGMTHTLNILRNKSLRLRAIVDIQPDAVKKNLHSKGGNFDTGYIDPAQLADIQIYASLQECLMAEKLDAVIISVHTRLHYEITKQALDNDLHVFLEKPFCLDIAQARELIELAGKKEKILMIGHVVRFMPPYERLMQWIDSGEFGPLKFLSLSRFSGRPVWGEWKDGAVSGTSGGALFDLVIHDIDFAFYAVGLPSDIQSSLLPGELSPYDYVNAVWKYEDRDTLVKIEGGNIFHTDFPFQAGYIARFEKASLVYTTLKAEVIRIADEERLYDVEAGDAGEGFYNEISYFAECAMTGRQPVKCLPESALKTIELCYRHIDK